MIGELLSNLTISETGSEPENDEPPDPVKAPDCQRCGKPARYQYKVTKTCSAGPYSVSKERCPDHALEEGSKGRFEGTELIKIFGGSKSLHKSKWAPLEMDPHYFCKKNDEKYCVEGHERTCPLNYTIRVER